MALADWIVSAPDPDAYGGGTQLVDDSGFLTGVIGVVGPAQYKNVANGGSYLDLDPFGWSVVFGVQPIGFAVADVDIALLKRKFIYRRFMGDSTRGAGHPALGRIMALEDAGSAGVFREAPNDTDLSSLQFFAFVVGLSRSKFRLDVDGLSNPNLPSD